MQFHTVTTLNISLISIIIENHYTNYGIKRSFSFIKNNFYYHIMIDLIKLFLKINKV